MYICVLYVVHVCSVQGTLCILHTQCEILRQKELQAKQMEEQRTQFKMRTQNLLQFREQSPEPKAKASRKKVMCTL